MQRVRDDEEGDAVAVRQLEAVSGALGAGGGSDAEGFAVRDVAEPFLGEKH